jgi:uncharacterized iron-regulated membrane protein
MKTFRTILFWSHLAAGSVAGIVVLIMCVTGVALTYEKQMIEWADRAAWAAPSVADADHLPPETLLAKITEARPGAAPTGITLRSDASAPATITLEGNKTLLVDPYSGAIIGEPPAQPRAFFRTMTSWHRYLARDGESRVAGKAVTGYSNLLFFFIVLSGMYLWLPRVWTWLQFKNVLWFRGGLASKARDFNWHNVIGIWSAVPLAIVVAGALPISFPWAGNLVYRVMGDTPPAPAAPAQQRSSDRAPVTYTFTGVDAAWAKAQEQTPAWRTITTRLATSPTAPVVLTVDEGYAGQPDRRTTYTIDRASGVVTKAEDFASLSAGRRARSWLRFAHTGEIYGLTGQTIAGAVSAGGAVLVYTGIALALRRLASWVRRRGSRADRDVPRAA